jgi:hypothetical protein
MHVKSKQTKMDPEQNLVCPKEDLLVCASYKLGYLSCIGVVLPEFCKNLFILLLHHVLGVIKTRCFYTKVSPHIIYFLLTKILDHRFFQS